ncbi:MAG: hypothetical protein H5T86_01540 [Armatimonadetes bacterium]|nr:hypothetical protein [Armatimonadota bacterium]
MKPWARRLWRRVTHQWPTKLASVGVAAILWVYVLNQQDPIGTREITVEVRASDTPEGTELVSIEPPELKVVLRGRRSVLENAEKLTRVVAELASAGVGTQEVGVRIASKPPGAEVIGLSTDRVRVVLDASVRAIRPVIVETRGLPAESYRALAPWCDPPTVTIVGPASLVSRVARVVAVVDISGSSATVNQQVKVEPRDEAGLVVGNVHVEPDKVRVVVPLRRVNVKVVPVWPRLTAPPRGYRVAAVTVRPAAVVISGSPSALDTVQFVSTDTIDIGGLRRGATYSVRLRVPAGVTLVGIASAQVTVSVEPLLQVSTREPAERQPAPGTREEQPATASPPTSSPAARPAPPATPQGPESPTASSPAADHPATAPSER